MNPEGSLPCTQQPTMGPCLEPDEYNLHLPIPSISFRYFDWWMSEDHIVLQSNRMLQDPVLITGPWILESFLGYP
jgi:hypothetical protein